LVDASVRGGDFSWPKTGTSRGHQRGHQLAKNGDFLMATDNVIATNGRQGASLQQIACLRLVVATCRNTVTGCSRSTKVNDA